MRFKQFLEFNLVGGGIPVDPGSFWKLPSLDSNPSTGRSSFTDLAYQLQLKNPMEMKALKKLSMKAEQLAASLRVQTGGWEKFFPATAKMLQDGKLVSGGIPLKPDVQAGMIINIATEDIRRTTGGGGYHQALMPYELGYAELSNDEQKFALTNKIIAPHQDNPDICDFNVEALRSAMTRYYSQYYGKLKMGQIADKAIGTIANKATQSWGTGYGVNPIYTGGVNMGV
jgi:hypothetical protein